MQLATEIEQGKNIVVLSIWTKRDLKQFSYDPYNIQQKPIKEFPNDFDVLEIVHASSDGLVAYGVSAITEVMSTFLPEDFATDKETGSRFCNGLEFQLYEQVE